VDGWQLLWASLGVAVFVVAGFLLWRDWQRRGATRRRDSGSRGGGYWDI
jgi:hypothetical protein